MAVNDTPTTVANTATHCLTRRAESVAESDTRKMVAEAVILEELEDDVMDIPRMIVVGMALDEDDDVVERTHYYYRRKNCWGVEVEEAVANTLCQRNCLISLSVEPLEAADTDAPVV